MKIEANDKTIQDIFSLGYFCIPRFQRPYSWTEDEVLNFWNDVVEQGNDQYFIGSMVVYQNEKPNFGIVDGQQRLTTITLLLAAIRNAFVKLSENNLAKGVHNYIEKANIDNINEFVLKSETSFPYLQGCIQSYSKQEIDCNIGTEELNLKLAFELITKKLSEKIPFLEPNSQKTLFDLGSTPVALLKKIRNDVLSLKLVFIQLDNEEDAYLIFETLNARGRDLTTPDLVKNLLLRNMKTQNSSLDSPKIRWDKILQNFDDAGIEQGMKTFLYHYWLSKHKYTTEKSLFSEIKSFVEENTNPDEFLKELSNNSSYYVALNRPNSYKWKPEELDVFNSLTALNLFKVRQQMPMVLALLRAYKNKNIKLRVLSTVIQKIENFHFLFNAVSSNRSSGSIASLYSKHAILLSQANGNDEVQSVLSSLIAGLRKRIPDFNEFSAGFENLEFTNRRTRDKKLIQYILRRFMGSNSNGFSIDFKTMTIEHLLPQNQIGVAVREEFVGKIGNLILVDHKTNGTKLGSQTFSKKIEYLKKIHYPLDDILVVANTWDEEYIMHRTQVMMKDAYVKLWKI